MIQKISLLIFIFIHCTIAVSQESSSYIHSVSKKSIKSFELKEGVQNTFFKMTNNRKWPMMVSVPKISNNQKVNLVLALHWGVNSSSYDEFMNCLVLPAFGTEKYLIVAPDSNHSPWWVDPKETQLIKLIKSIKENWPIDKVIVTGYSDGGTGSFYMAKNHPDVFDGAIALAGSYGSAKKIDIPTYFIHGVGDQLFSYTRTKNIVSEIQENSNNIEFITTNKLTHYEACQYVELLKDGIKWMEEKLELSF